MWRRARTMLSAGLIFILMCTKVGVRWCQKEIWARRGPTVQRNVKCSFLEWLKGVSKPKVQLNYETFLVACPLASKSHAELRNP